MASEHQATRFKILVQANGPRPRPRRWSSLSTAKEKREGTVVAVGPGRWDEDGEADPAGCGGVTPSSTASTAAPRSNYNGEEYLILSARSVLASFRSDVFRPAIPVLTTGDFQGGMQRTSLRRGPDEQAIEYDETARRAMEVGMDKLADTVRVTLGPRSRHGAGQERLADHGYQRRRHGGT